MPWHHLRQMVIGQCFSESVHLYFWIPSDLLFTKGSCSAVPCASCLIIDSLTYQAKWVVFKSLLLFVKILFCESCNCNLRFYCQWGIYDQPGFLWKKLLSTRVWLLRTKLNSTSLLNMTWNRASLSKCYRRAEQLNMRVLCWSETTNSRQVKSLKRSVFTYCFRKIQWAAFQTTLAWKTFSNITVGIFWWQPNY